MQAVKDAADMVVGPTRGSGGADRNPPLSTLGQHGALAAASSAGVCVAVGTGVQAEGSGSPARLAGGGEALLMGPTVLGPRWGATEGGRDGLTWVRR